MGIERVELVVRGGAAHEDAVARESLRREFPSVPVEWVERPRSDAVVFDASAWNDDACGFRPFDDAVCAVFGSRAEDAGHALAIAGSPASLPRVAEQMLTRYQRFVRRRNAGSSIPGFDGVLARHHTLHDSDKPLVRSDFDHALDVWHWVLRLDPCAGAAVQIAALFHDVDRLTSEASARAGARVTHAILRESGVDLHISGRAVWLVAGYDHASEVCQDEEIALLNDADALSFFSLNSAGYLKYFGAEQTCAKVRYTLGRLRPAARARLPRLRYAAEVGRIVHAELTSAPTSTVIPVRPSFRSIPPSGNDVNRDNVGEL